MHINRTNSFNAIQTNNKNKQGQEKAHLNATHLDSQSTDPQTHT